MVITSYMPEVKCSSCSAAYSNIPKLFRAGSDEY